MIASMLAADPLLSGGVGLHVVLVVIVKAVFSFVFLLVGVMLMVWFERKLISGMQNRVGPNKAGPWGLLQTLADGTKLFFKEDLIPDQADRFVFKLAPYLSLVPAFLVFSVVPIGGDFNNKAHPGQMSILGKWTLMQLADPPIGILLVLALSSLAVYGIMLAGWASGSKYPLLGSVRASAQMVSYEAALGMSVASVLLISGTLSTSGIVAKQDWFGSWNVVATVFVPFVIFVIAATAEANRPPFDLVEAEQELVGGFNTEYTSIRFALFYLSEFMNTVTMSAIIVTLFLGGPQPPFRFLHDIPGPRWLYGVVWFFLKLYVFLYMYVWFRATLPRFRYDQLMDLGWKLLIPASLGWLLLLIVVRVTQSAGWQRPGRIAAAVGAAAIMGVFYLLLLAAFRVSARNRAREGTMF